jgi:sugar lactone lactonase YvrE
MSYVIKSLQNISSNIYKPFRIANDLLDNIYIVQSFYRCIVKVNKFGNIIQTIGTSNNISGDELGSINTCKFDYISDIYCDKNNILFINDSGNNKIKYLDDISKEIKLYIDLNLHNIKNLYNLVIDNQNNIYISVFDNNLFLYKIYKIDNNKIISLFTSNSFYNYYMCLDYDKLSRLYISNFYEICVYDLNGILIYNITLNQLNIGILSISHDNNDIIYFTVLDLLNNHTINYQSNIFTTVNSITNSNIIYYLIDPASTQNVNAQIFSGQIDYGFKNGSLNIAKYYNPSYLIYKNDILYVADAFNNMIRIINISNQLVTTLIGTLTYGLTNDNIQNALFNFPKGVTVNTDNMYICDSYNNEIRQYNLPSNIVTLYSGDSSGNSGSTDNPPKYDEPSGLCIDSQNNIYVCDYNNASIRKIDNNKKVITIINLSNIYPTLFNTPYDIKMDKNNNLFITNSSANNIIKLDANYNPSIFAGSLTGISGYKNGNGNIALFNFPEGIIIDSFDNIYIADTTNNVIRKITQTKNVTTFCGNNIRGHQDGNANDASFNGPAMMSIDSDDNIYVCDSGNGMIRKINNLGYVTTIIYGYRLPIGILYNSPYIYVTDYCTNLITKIEKINASQEALVYTSNSGLYYIIPQNKHIYKFVKNFNNRKSIKYQKIINNVNLQSIYQILSFN